MARLSALFVLLTPALATAAERAPAPRAVLPRFDLEYLPKVGGQGVLGIRPAEIAKHATTAEVRLASGLVFGTFSQMLGGKQLDAAWPTFADLEQCVCCLDLRVTAPPSRGERGSLLLGGKTPALVRTIRPFDWAGLFRKSFPNTSTASRAGRSYLRVPTPFQFPFPYVGLVGEPMAAYFPDDRTLAIGAEGDVRALLDRLAAGTPAPAPLPGWGEVDRDLIAFALDNREAPLISGRFPDGYPAGKELEALARSLRTLAVGLSNGGDRTRVRFVATAKDANDARTTADALRSLIRQAAEALAESQDPQPLEAFAAALLGSAAIDRDGRNVTATLTADGNLVKMLFTFLRGPA